jgi:hypothetical protein
MRRCFVPLLIMTSLFVFGPLPAAALTLDANVLGIYTDSSFATPLPGVTISPDGDVATAPLAAGQGVLIGIEVSNPAAETITAIFATLFVRDDQIANVFSLSQPDILKGPDPSDQALTDINATGTIQFIGQRSDLDPFNQVHQIGTSGPVYLWVQAVAHVNAAGAFGTGPDTLLIPVILGDVGAADQIAFDMALAPWDAIEGPSSVTFIDAVINPIPEPGTALLMGLGLFGLTALRRREFSIRSIVGKISSSPASSSNRTF